MKPDSMLSSCINLGKDSQILMPMPELKTGSCSCRSKRRVFPEMKPSTTARAWCCFYRLPSRGLWKAGSPCTIGSFKLAQASAFLLLTRCGLLATFLSPSQETRTVLALTQTTRGWAEGARGGSLERQQVGWAGSEEDVRERGLEEGACARLGRRRSFGTSPPSVWLDPSVGVPHGRSRANPVGGLLQRAWKCGATPREAFGGERSGGGLPEDKIL